MSEHALFTELKQHLHEELDGSLGSVEEVGVGEGLAILPANDGRPSGMEAVLSNPAKPLPFIPKAEQERSDFQEWVQAKRTILDQMATNLPILGGYRVSMPRRGYRKTETRLTVEVVENVLRPRTARLEGLNGPGNERLIFADFDLLPSSYPTFDHLGDVLSHYFGDKACVTASSGGHLKVMFRVLGKNWSKEEVRQFLAWQFGGKAGQGGLWAQKGQRLNKKRQEVSAYCIDRQGTDNTFINMDMLEVFQQSYPNLHLFTSFRPEGQTDHSSIQVFPSTTYSAGVNPPEAKPFLWNSYLGEIPKAIQDLRNNELLVKVFRAAAGSFYVSTTFGVALPQKQLGQLFGVSHQQVSNAIHRLIRLGVIRLNIAACHLQGRAAKYQFVGPYLEWAKKQYEGIKAQKAHNNSPEIQKSYRASIEARLSPGEMNLALFEFTRFFDSFEAYLSACTEHSYFGQKPEHIYQAEGAWKSRERLRREEAEKRPAYLKEA